LFFWEPNVAGAAQPVGCPPARPRAIPRVWHQTSIILDTNVLSELNRRHARHADRWNSNRPPCDTGNQKRQTLCGSNRQGRESLGSQALEWSILKFDELSFHPIFALNSGDIARFAIRRRTSPCPRLLASAQYPLDLVTLKVTFELEIKGTDSDHQRTMAGFRLHPYDSCSDICRFGAGGRTRAYCQIGSSASHPSGSTVARAICGACAARRIDNHRRHLVQRRRHRNVELRRSGTDGDIAVVSCN
jgi:hypothetical protein